MRKFVTTLVFILAGYIIFHGVGETLAYSANTNSREAPTFSYFAPNADYVRIPQLNKAETQSCPCKNAAKVDFVFMIDVTGSMGWCIDSVKSNVQAFSESLINQGVDARFSIIEFSDQINCSQTSPTTIYQLEGNSYWTSDVTLLEAGLERARQAEYWNPGWEETPNHAIYMLLNVLAPTFRSNASRFAFLLTDEQNNSYNTEMFDTMANCARRLKQANIRTSVISLEELRWDFEVLCTETKGMYIDLQTPNYYLMMLEIADWVAEVTGLTVHVMERSTLQDKGNIDSPETPNLICDARSSSGYYQKTSRKPLALAMGMNALNSLVVI